MTSRHTTGFLSLRETNAEERKSTLSDILYRLLFGAIGWPWLLYSLWGGTKRSKRELLERVGLDKDALPNLGSWKADTGFLHRIVDAVEELQPRVVIELGAGATTLVCAKAMERNGRGQLMSFDQHGDFVTATGEWLASEGVDAEIRCAPLKTTVEGWPGRWYTLGNLPEKIDLIIIDGPPWTVHPFVRGAAECLFDRLAPGGMVLLDDAARPGERIVANRWRRRWPEISFDRAAGSTKGTLVGRKSSGGGQVFAPSKNAANDNSRRPYWQRIAGIAAVFAAGWMANELTGDLSSPASAASLVNEAQEAYVTSLVRQEMTSQIESIELDRHEILDATGMDLPALPTGWKVTDAQVFPSDLGNAMMISLMTPAGEKISLFAAQADTSIGGLPLMEATNGLEVAYWKEGPVAVALVGQLESGRLLELAVDVSHASSSEKAEKLASSRLRR